MVSIFSFFWGDLLEILVYINFFLFVLIQVIFCFCYCLVMKKALNGIGMIIRTGARKDDCVIEKMNGKYYFSICKNHTVGI